jgi:selenocysteine-specific elongation factor
MPVERAFSAQGFGTIVSGIPVSGTARIGDEVELLPARLAGRIRGIEAYGQTAQAVMAGQCAAIQFRHWDHKEIARGNTLAAPGLFSAEERLLVRLQMLAIPGLSLESGVQVKFHAGTADVLARVYPLEGTRLAGGVEYLAQINVAVPAVVGPRDRFVIRGLSPVTTVGGGVVVESFARRLKRNRPGVREEAAARAAAVMDERAFAEYAVLHSEAPAATRDGIALRTKVPAKRLDGILAELAAGGVILALPGGRYLHRDRAAMLEEEIAAAIDAFHKESPTSAGVAPEKLQETVGVEKDVFGAFVDRLIAGKRIVARNGLLALASHTVALSDKAQETVARVERIFVERLYTPPVADETAAALGMAKRDVEAAEKVLIERGALVRVSPEFLFHKSAVDAAREKVLAHIVEKGSLPSVDFKYLVDTTRKYAIPLLDYFDKIGVTLRIGNTRYIKKR